MTVFLSTVPAPRRRRRRPPLLLARLLLVACLAAVRAQQEVTLRELDDANYASAYPGITALGGLLIPDNGVQINVMYPPQPKTADPDSSPTDNVCAVPNWLANLGADDVARLQVADTHPICLVVTGSERACLLEQQVRAAQRLQDTVSDRVKCLIAYGNAPDIYNLDIQDYSVAVIYIPLLAGEDLRSRLDRLAADTNRSAYFFDPSGANADWRAAFGVQPYGGAGGYYVSGADHFFWFRIVLFTLLIVSPCLRAGYLWYAGGGRVHLRRNDRGRVVGLQLVPPMPHWLSSGIIIRPTEPVSSVLTEEQFQNLPTVMYQPAGPKPDEDGSEADEAGPRRDADSAAGTAPGPRLSLVDALEQGGADGASGPAPPTALPAATDTAADRPLAPSYTLCSICIEDFEAGEALTILPRCQHAFHKDCIHPWLTERQGCCPLCKTNVLQQPDAGPRDEPQPNRRESSSPDE